MNPFYIVYFLISVKGNVANQVYLVQHTVTCVHMQQNHAHKV